METCYKVFRREIIQAIPIEENRFGFEPEITVKVAKRRLRIYEVGISYWGRTYEEGKKIGWKDGLPRPLVLAEIFDHRAGGRSQDRCQRGAIARKNATEPAFPHQLVQGFPVAAPASTPHNTESARFSQNFRRPQGLTTSSSHLIPPHGGELVDLIAQPEAAQELKIQLARMAIMGPHRAPALRSGVAA